ncbi:transposase [Halomonas sp. B23F22_10]|uniref:transposase n=1 Tax=Halomonas sp. B23F22_10 TaxID=3459515 RepID=UPI00373F2784
MARQARFLLPNTPLHLVQRGNNRGVCFATEDDCRHYLELLETIIRDSGIQIHAYVLMTNHVHLLASPGDDPGAISAMPSASTASTGEPAPCSRDAFVPAW